MLFNSWQFLLFFPTVTLVYFLLPHRFRWLSLLLSSCLFYMAFIPVYIFILAATIIVDYTAAIMLEHTADKKRILFFYLSITATCLILFYFKYFNFVVLNVNYIAGFLHWNYSASTMKIILPIGLSFHTFQSLSYVIEVYRGNQKAERHFGIYALYVMFYPQLVAGPIERPQNLLHQFYTEHRFEYRRVTSGLKIMFWGLFKKVVIADRLALFVGPVYDHPDQYPGAILLIATIFFSFQVYCDFSGYSDIAIGSARVMGFDLMRNFDRPYSSKTLSEFWKRWHISLSTWLRDYVYDPISINLRNFGTAAIIAALTITFFISGLWHGANWNFVIWGLLHGTALSLEALSAGLRKKISKRLPKNVFNTISVALTFSFVTFTYIFFRSKTLKDALYIAAHIFRMKTIKQFALVFKQTVFHRMDPIAAFSNFQFRLAVMLILCLGYLQNLQQKDSEGATLPSRPMLRWLYYYGLVFFLLTFGVWFTNRDFIYFQF